MLGQVVDGERVLMKYWKGGNALFGQDPWERNSAAAPAMAVFPMTL